MTILRTSYVLAVRDLAKASAHWRDVLGFESALRPPGWDVVERDQCRVMLGECPDDPPASEIGAHSYFAHLMVDDVDAYHAEIAARGAEILPPPADKPWGLREMAVRTPDGHRIMFAQAIG